MAKRKSLLDTVEDLSAEEKAFIDAGRPKPAEVAAAVVSSPPKLPVDLREDKREPDVKPPRPSTAKVEPKPKSVKQPEPERAVMVADTFKLPQETVTRLLQASFTRKMTKSSPYTKQAIVAEALEQWLEANGF